MEIAQMILTHAGFLVKTAEDGQIAIDKISASDPWYYNAVLMDIRMPVMDGYDATRAIRSLKDPSLSGIPILAVTANAIREDIQAAEAAGMQAHIAKPIDIGVLMKMLAGVLQAAEKQKMNARNHVSEPVQSNPVDFERNQ